MPDPTNNPSPDGWPAEWLPPSTVLAGAGALAAPVAPPLATTFAGPPDGPLLRDRRDAGDDDDRGNSAVIPHPYTFTALYNSVQGLYPAGHWDEALRRSIDDALAMRRDAFLHELLRQRQMPVAQLPFHIESEDPDDPEQQAACEQLQAIIERSPSWTDMRMVLSEAIFYGKAGVQFWTRATTCKGRRCRVVGGWLPINGDKIGWTWEGVPTIAIQGAWTPPEGAEVRFSDRGRVMVLNEPRFRRQFVIHQWERTDMDYLLESEKSTAVHGLGLRDRLYWAWYLRQEIQSYYFDGLQRLSTDGMLVGYYDEGNPREKDATRDGLKNLHRDKIALLPRKHWGKDSAKPYDHIPASNIAYQELREGLTHFEDEMRRVVLGQNLSSQSDSTGLGSKVAELHDDTFTRIIRYDARALDETITRDLLPVLVAANEWTYRGKRANALPFRLRYVSEIDRPDVGEKMTAAQTFAWLGGRLDLEQLGTDAGLPLDPSGQPTAEEQEQMRAQQTSQAGPGDPGADDRPDMDSPPKTRRGPRITRRSKPLAVGNSGKPGGGGDVGRGVGVGQDRGTVAARDRGDGVGPGRAGGARRPGGDRGARGRVDGGGHGPGAGNRRPGGPARGSARRPGAVGVPRPSRNARSAALALVLDRYAADDGANCGTGAGGFQEGNTCAAGGGGDVPRGPVNPAMDARWPKTRGEMRRYVTAEGLRPGHPAHVALEPIHAFGEAGGPETTLYRVRDGHRTADVMRSVGLDDLAGEMNVLGSPDADATNHLWENLRGQEFRINNPSDPDEPIEARALGGDLFMVNRPGRPFAFVDSNAIEALIDRHGEHVEDDDDPDRNARDPRGLIQSLARRSLERAS